MKRPRITPTLTELIAKGIRSGGYPHVVAQARGVSPNVFDDWMRRGRKSGAREPYRTFATVILEAYAQARLLAEAVVFKDDPKMWLRQGPGRETGDNLGWSSAVRPRTAESSADFNALACEKAMEIIRGLLDVLVLYPEARQALIAHLASNGLVPETPTGDAS